jgi:hypothetical protein
MQPSKPSKTFVFLMNFNDLTIQRNMIFDDFLIFSVTSFSIFYSGKKTPKWFEKATKMGPQITPKQDF